MEKIKLWRKNFRVKRYTLNVPKHFKELGSTRSSTITIGIKYGKYCFFPSFWGSEYLSAEEVIAIADKLKELNKEEIK